MHIYAFGSICRGEVAADSDIDLLALVKGHDSRFDQSKYSIYSYSKIEQMWDKGSPFAWHLHLESRLLYATNNCDFLKSLGKPRRYLNCLDDCRKFQEVFEEARSSIFRDSASLIFDLSAVFLSIRNISTCFSLGVLGQPNFSRNAALALTGDLALPISANCHRTIEKCRILCTRSLGPAISDEEATKAVSEFSSIAEWMAKLVTRAEQHERIHQSS